MGSDCISSWSLLIFLLCTFGNIPSNDPWGNMQSNTFWLKLDLSGLSLAVTLKIRSRSPKPIQLFIIFKYGSNPPAGSWDIVHTSTFWLKFGCLSPAMTLKIGSRSLKPNQLFIMSQCYIHANWVKIHLPVHEISCIQESIMPTPTPTPTGSAKKQYVPLPFGGDHNDI